MRKIQIILVSLALFACGGEDSRSGSAAPGGGGPDEEAPDGDEEGAPDEGEDGEGGEGGGVGGEGDEGDGPLEIAGLWEDDFGGSFDIADGHWGEQTVVRFDNDANIAITQNPPGIEHFPEAFNKLVWTDPDDEGGFWVCTIGFGHETAELAAGDEAMPDAADPGQAGCSGFPWSRMTPGIEIFGDWESNFGGLTHINRRWWGDARIERFDNAGNVAITQNRADDAWNPAKFNRVQWTETADGAFHFCTVAFGKDTADEAADDPNSADATDPSASGCGGFPWTKLFDPIEIHGHFEDQFGFATSIATGVWGGATIVKYDDGGNWAITQQPADAEFGAGSFSRIAWTEPDYNGEFWWCTEAFGLESLQAAGAADAIADATDPEAGGCGDFPWSKATPTVEVFGEWVDDFDGAWEIGGGKWGDWSVVSYDNATNRAIVQYAEDDEHNPGKYSKVFWTDIDADGAWAYCSANFGKETAQEADEGPESADPTDLDGAGCGGFPWSRMMPAPAPEAEE